MSLHPPIKNVHLPLSNQNIPPLTSIYPYPPVKNVHPLHTPKIYLHPPLSTPLKMLNNPNLPKLYLHLDPPIPIQTKKFNLSPLTHWKGWPFMFSCFFSKTSSLSSNSWFDFNMNISISTKFDILVVCRVVSYLLCFFLI